MLYINQLEHENISYLTDLDHPKSDFATKGTIKVAGCGICAICMVLDRLSDKSLSLEDAVKISYAVGANREIGTDMSLLSKAFAKKFNFYVEFSDDINALIECLQDGGCAIINVGGDHDDHIGVFSHTGHYITAVSYKEGEFMILDPSRTPDKFKEKGRGMVRETKDAVFVSLTTIEADTKNRTPSYYLFKQKVLIESID
ncbi:C39 family peptidase [Cellulosilyticum ruminicola]|uniref:C39 family peptidase n=1 Tax=Cellulosilyticum ruminicola TaxID=425254 RepID=UPI0006D27511|nr:C39 family peptidase [Cellulosilyticum ruminicola]